MEEHSKFEFPLIACEKKIALLRQDPEFCEVYAFHLCIEQDD